MPVITAILVIAVILVIGCICISNSLNQSLVKIDEAASGIDVALTKRYDVLTKMIEVAKGYSKHEQETLFKTIELRKNMTMQEKSDANEAMGEAFSRINALAENYPDLKANTTFTTLQQSISDVEEHLQASRRLYNANVSAFNQKIVTFPISFIANAKGLSKKDFFVADDVKREDVKINF
ncbi:MAG: LemA family protein [Clostridia bacterium]|nr:LemA family protein [Clostridia bacterium]